MQFPVFPNSSRKLQRRAYEEWEFARPEKPNSWYILYIFSTKFYIRGLHHYYSRKADFIIYMLLLKRMFINRAFLLLKLNFTSTRPGSYSTVESSQASLQPVWTSLVEETPFLWMYMDKHRVLWNHRVVSNLSETEQK